jgi:hypothetical protein
MLFLLSALILVGALRSAWALWQLWRSLPRHNADFDFRLDPADLDVR